MPPLPLPAPVPPPRRISGVRAAVRRTPFPRAAEIVGEIAVAHARAGRLEEARAAIEDADALLGGAIDARVAVILGEALLTLNEAHAAKLRFESAIAVLRAKKDVPAEARARFGLGRAMLMLGDPRARVALEDAGTLYEDVGDEALVHAIDRALRDAAAEFDESPRSFHAR